MEYDKEFTAYLQETEERTKLLAQIEHEREERKKLLTAIKRNRKSTSQLLAESTHYLAEGREFRKARDNIFISCDGVLQYKTKTGFIAYKEPSIQPAGRYPHYTIQGKHYQIHHLVMDAWGPPKPFEGAIIRHLDDNKNNCKIANLAWGTGKDNWDDMFRNNIDTWVTGRYHHRQKLSVVEALEIMYRLECGSTAKSLARKFGVNNKTVRDIRDGKTWKYARDHLYSAYKSFILD